MKYATTTSSVPNAAIFRFGYRSARGPINGCSAPPANCCPPINTPTAVALVPKSSSSSTGINVKDTPIAQDTDARRANIACTRGFAHMVLQLITFADELARDKSSDVLSLLAIRKLRDILESDGRHVETSMVASKNRPAIAMKIISMLV